MVRDSRQQAVGSRQQAADYLWLTANCLWSVTRRLLPAACCLLLTAYCLLPTAYCLLPTAYCFTPPQLTCRISVVSPHGRSLSVTCSAFPLPGGRAQLRFTDQFAGLDHLS